MLSFIVILPDDERRSIERNYQIIRALQVQVEGPISAGVYDGRKNFFTSSDLEFEEGAREVGLSSRYLILRFNMFPVFQYVVLMGAEFRVRLTHVASINPECALF
jgi:hypothetical protein